MTDTKTMTDDERRFRDNADWLQSTIARWRDVPGRESEVGRLRQQLDDLRQNAVRRGWVTVDLIPRNAATRERRARRRWAASHGHARSTG